MPPRFPTRGTGRHSSRVSIFASLLVNRYSLFAMRSVRLFQSPMLIAYALSDKTSDELTKTAHTGYPRTQRNIFAASSISPPTSPHNEKTPHPIMIARPAMSCGSQCHHISQTMPSDVITDTVPCLPSRPPSRPRPVIISYRIPDDIATQSITGDTRYDDPRLPLLSPPHLIAPAASRPASRLTVSPDGSARSTTPS